MTDGRILNLLFVCTHDSARSIFAECVMNRLGMGRFKSYSAAGQPDGQVHTFANEPLGNLNYDVSGARSKSWEGITAPGGPPTSLDMLSLQERIDDIGRTKLDTAP
jgi:arsenate reductase (thioredoxin)